MEIASTVEFPPVHEYRRNLLDSLRVRQPVLKLARTWPATAFDPLETIESSNSLFACMISLHAMLLVVVCQLDGTLAVIRLVTIE